MDPFLIVFCILHLLRKVRWRPGHLRIQFGPITWHGPTPFPWLAVARSCYDYGHARTDQPLPRLIASCAER